MQTAFALAVALATVAHASVPDAAPACSLQQANFGTRDLYVSGSSKTGCRSLGEDQIKGLVLNDKSVQRVEFFDAWGCYGKPVVTASTTTDVKTDKNLLSCRVVTKDTVAPKDYTPAPAVATTNATAGTPTVANNKTSSHAAILYEAANYNGIKHWIDGEIGECRGLSGVDVESVKMIQFGTDNEIVDDVTLAFFDDYGCTGNIIGAVTGTQPRLCESMTNNVKNDGAIPCDGHAKPVTAYSSSVASSTATIASPTNVVYTNATAGTAGVAQKLYRRSVKNDTAAPVVYSKDIARPADGSCGVKAKSVRFVKTGSNPKGYGQPFATTESAASGSAMGLFGASALAVMALFN